MKSHCREIFSCAKQTANSRRKWFNCGSANGGGGRAGGVWQPRLWAYKHTRPNRNKFHIIQWYSPAGIAAAYETNFCDGTWESHASELNYGGNIKCVECVRAAVCGCAGQKKIMARNYGRWVCRSDFCGIEYLVFFEFPIPDWVPICNFDGVAVSNKWKYGQWLAHRSGMQAISSFAFKVKNIIRRRKINRNPKK